MEKSRFYFLQVQFGFRISNEISFLVIKIERIIDAEKSNDKNFFCSNKTPSSKIGNANLTYLENHVRSNKSEPGTNYFLTQETIFAQCKSQSE